MTLDLDDDDVDLLREILDGEFRDTRYEIADTDNSRFKRELRARATRVEALLAQIGGPLPDRP